MATTDDSFNRVYRASQRLFTHPYVFAGLTIVAGLLALIVTLGAILQPVPALTRVAGIVTALFLWLSTAVFFNFWQKWNVVYAWKQDREELQRKSDRVDAYFKKVDAGELPAEPIPPEILQDFRDVHAAWRQELLRQEWRE